MKKWIQKIWFKYILGVNFSIPWEVHFTSQIIDWQNIEFPNGMGKHSPGDSMGNYIQASNGIIFGKDVNLGPNVSIVSANHDLKKNEVHVKGTPIKIGDRVWIGAGAIVLPEVELADGIVVGAGSVVTKSFLEEDIIIAGNPAKKIGPI